MSHLYSHIDQQLDRWVEDNKAIGLSIASDERTINHVNQLLERKESDKNLSLSALN